MNGPTVTGHFSSREPNMTNIPKHTKEVRQTKAAFIGQMDPVEVDLSWAEERVLANKGDK